MLKLLWTVHDELLQRALNRIYRSETLEVLSFVLICSFSHFFHVGVGYGMLLATAIGNTSFMLVTAYILHYLFSSMRRTLPWVGCDNEWNTDFCSTRFQDCIVQTGMIVAGNGSCVVIENVPSSDLVVYGIDQDSSGNYDYSQYMDPLAGKRVRPSEEYWK